MNIRVLYEIYLNVFKYINSRNLETDDTVMNLYDFITKATSDLKVTINTNKSIIIIAVPDSKYATLNIDSRKYIKELSKSKKEEILYICDIFNMGDKRASNSLIIKKLLDDINTINNTIYVQIRNYKNFIIDISSSNVVPKHRIVDDKEEFKKTIKNMYIKLSSLPKILDCDTAATWIGAKPGDIIEVDRPSVTCNIYTQYRLVIS